MKKLGNTLSSIDFKIMILVESIGQSIYKFTTKVFRLLFVFSNGKCYIVGA